MSRPLVLNYSTFGHVEVMANEIAAIAREAGSDVTIKRVPALMPKEALEASGAKHDQAEPVIEDPNELVDYDGIVFGTPTRFGVHLDRWRAGDDNHLLPLNTAAPRLHDRGITVFLEGVDGPVRGAGWIALWGRNHCRSGRQTHTE